MKKHVMIDLDRGHLSIMRHESSNITLSISKPGTCISVSFNKDEMLKTVKAISSVIDITKVVK